jgi:Cu(I)/Ag(I) efflux system membrane fusion protein
MTRARTLIALVTTGLVALGVGILIGRMSHGSAVGAPKSSEADGARQQTYTCSMHPQIRLGRPGKCPICEMPLIPADAAQSSADGAPMLQLSEHALAMANVETVAVARRELARELRTVGKVEYNEASLATVTARVDGYAERLFVNFTGVEMQAGDHLAEIYSPDLLLAQQELLIAVQGDVERPMVETSKLKLLRWGLTEAQIQALIDDGQLADRITLYSQITGTVIEKSIVQNSAFEAGDALYRVANLDTVWVYLDIYEYDLAWLRYGQSVELRAEALPADTFSGMVTFVQPIVSEDTRTIRVPVHVENPEHLLKPGMFVSAIVRSTLASDGTAAPTGVEGKFTCPMHPQVLLEDAGKCPSCEMPLQLIPGSPAPAVAVQEPGALDTSIIAPTDSGVTAVPITAVLDSGQRRIVYVERSRGLFEAREVTVGPRGGEHFAILDGLTDGERVVSRGGFLIDSQFQISGQPSLFYPGGLMAGSTRHQHGGPSAPGARAMPPAADAPTAPPRTTGSHDH